MMERLTEKVFGFIQLKACGNDFCTETCAEQNEEKSCKNCPMQKAFEKLATYEDLEEQGLLLQLPCKVGDTVYIISRNNEIIPLNVYGIDIRKDNFTILVKDEKYYGQSILSLLGKYESVDWFITQAEAEQKLNKMSK